MNVMAVFWGMFAWGLAELILLGIILIFAGQPMMAYLSARFRHSPLLLFHSKSGRTRFITGKYSGGAISTKQGTYLTDPKAMRGFYATDLGIVYEKVGATIPEEVATACKKLKDMGINDTRLAEEYLTNLAEQGIAKEDLTKEQSTILENIEVVADFFKYSMNPSQIEAKIQNAINKREGKKDKNTLMLLGGIGFAAFMILVGLFIFMTVFKCPKCPSWAEVQAASAAASSVVKGGSII